MLTNKNNWSGFQKFIFKLLFCWVVIFVFSFSFSYRLLPDIGAYTSPFFESAVRWFAKYILQLRHPYNSSLVSDSTGLYIHALLVLCYAVIISLVWTIIDKNRPSYNRLFYLFCAGIRYYLALQLFTYGFSKVFKWQFYLPEPNTLFTTVGETPKDLLYWSAMGASRAYSIFSGMAELIAASLLLFRKTYIIGALFATGILFNVVAINFGFDISVKLFSLFLLLLCLVLLTPFVQPLIQFFFLQRHVMLQPISISFNPKHAGWYRFVKFIAIALVIVDPLSLYIKTKNFNDDTDTRPLLHGAYRVNAFIVNNDTIRPAQTSGRWNRVFVHRQGYFITQDREGTMQDYTLQYDTGNHFLVVTDYQGQVTYNLHYDQQSPGKLELKGKWGNNQLDVHLLKIPIEQLPLLQEEFNWTIDQ